MEKLVDRVKEGNAKRGYHTHRWQNIKSWRRPGLTPQKGTRLRNEPSELCSLQHHVLQLLPAQPELPLQLLLPALRAPQLLWYHPARGLLTPQLLPIISDDWFPGSWISAAPHSHPLLVHVDDLTVT